MAIAILSDPHANLEATEAVFRDLEQRHISELYHCGDIVGYGPSPVEVVREYRTRDIPGVPGNHDVYMVEPFSDKIVPPARAMVDFAKLCLRKPDAVQEKAWVEALVAGPLYRIVATPLGKTMLVHGAPTRDQEYLRYIHPPRGQAHSSRFSLESELDALFGEALSLSGQNVDAIIMGHTHEAYIWTPPGNKRHLINAGSVGQPRDHDPQSAYLLIQDDGKPEIIRVAYDIPAVQRKLLELQTPRSAGFMKKWHLDPGSADFLAKRLARGF